MIIAVRNSAKTQTDVTLNTPAIISSQIDICTTMRLFKLPLSCSVIAIKKSKTSSLREKN